MSDAVKEARERVREGIKKKRIDQKERVLEHKGYLKNVLRPYLRNRKREHDERVEVITEYIKGKHRGMVKRAREHVRENQLLQKEKVKAQKEKIREQQKVQHEIIEDKIAQRDLRLKPMIERKQKEVEQRKIDRRTKAISEGRLLQGYSTIPHKKFFEATSYSPKHSTVSDREFTEKTTYSPKYSTTPDQDWSDKVMYSPKHSTLWKQEYTEKYMFSPKFSTVPDLEFTDLLHFSVPWMERELANKKWAMEKKHFKKMKGKSEETAEKRLG